MPTYTAQCTSCGTQQDFIRKVDDRDNAPDCCSRPMERLGAYAIAPAIGAMTWTGHKAVRMLDGRWIESGAEYHRYLKETNSIPASEGAREAEIQKENLKREHAKVRRKAVEDAVRQKVN